MWITHCIGGGLGGGVMAIGAWLLLSPVRTLFPIPSPALIVVGVGLLAILVDLHIVDRPLRGRQVPSTWYRRYGPVRAYWMFGLFLGGGLSAHVPHAVTYSAFAAISLLTPLPQAALCGVLFGAARTLLVGPAALVPDASARVLYVSGSSRWAFPKLSAVLSALVIALVVTSLL